MVLMEKLMGIGGRCLRVSNKDYCPLLPKELIHSWDTKKLVSECENCAFYWGTCEYKNKIKEG